MLGQSTHAWKVNFCKFTNETRNGIEDSSRHEGLKSLAAVNGTVAGGGYELALACDEILMIDDRSSTVSLPELPLLGVLPGTGGLTRVTDNRDVVIDWRARAATITVFAPRSEVPSSLEAIHAAGDTWWPLAMARELDDAILMLRTNDLEIGTWIFNTRGDMDKALAADAAMKANENDWFVRQVIGFLRRTLARLDVTSRTLFAIIDKGSCFAGTLFELALAADRSYMLQLPDDETGPPAAPLSEVNFRPHPYASREGRTSAHFCGESQPLDAARARIGEKLDAKLASESGLVTFTPDDLDS